MQSRGSHARRSGPGLARSSRRVDRIEDEFDRRFEYEVRKAEHGNRTTALAQDEAYKDNGDTDTDMSTRATRGRARAR